MPTFIQWFSENKFDLARKKIQSGLGMEDWLFNIKFLSDIDYDLESFTDVETFGELMETIYESHRNESLDFGYPENEIATWALEGAYRLWKEFEENGY